MPDVVFFKALYVYKHYIKHRHIITILCGARLLSLTPRPHPASCHLQQYGSDKNLGRGLGENTHVCIYTASFRIQGTRPAICHLAVQENGNYRQTVGTQRRLKVISNACRIAISATWWRNHMGCHWGPHWNVKSIYTAAPSLVWNETRSVDTAREFPIARYGTLLWAE